MDTGRELHTWASDLFPICRSITGNGVRKTLHYLRRLLPQIEIHEVASGTPVGDWIIPDEWNIEDAYIADSQGNRLIDFQHTNLHVMGYSEPVDAVLSRSDLEPHLYSLPNQPDAIPYVTSYYQKRWGFCLSEHQRARLGDGPFHVVIKSRLEPGSLTYGDLVIPGKSDREVLLSTYVCHPSMANNELSGPVVTVALGRWLMQQPELRYTYRLVFAPETIGAITYLSHHLEELRSKTVAGWVVTCVGDDRTYSYVPSRLGNTLADRISTAALCESVGQYDAYSFLDRGSDERQWCSPAADLPVCSVMRSKYGTYPEYHTSRDDLSLVTETGLQGGLDILRRCIEIAESNHVWRVTTVGEPALGRRGLYPTISYKGSADAVRTMMNVLAHCDGQHDVLSLCKTIGASAGEVVPIIEQLASAGLLADVDCTPTP